MISVVKNLLRFVTWPRKWPILASCHGHLKRMRSPAVGCSRSICQVLLVDCSIEPRVVGTPDSHRDSASFRSVGGFAVFSVASASCPTVCTHPGRAALVGRLFCPCVTLSRSAPLPGVTLSVARLILPRNVHVLCLPARPPSACLCRCA